MNSFGYDNRYCDNLMSMHKCKMIAVTSQLENQNCEFTTKQTRK